MHLKRYNDNNLHVILYKRQIGVERIVERIGSKQMFDSSLIHQFIEAVVRKRLMIHVKFIREQFRPTS